MRHGRKLCPITQPGLGPNAAPRAALCPDTIEIREFEEDSIQKKAEESRKTEGRGEKKKGGKERKKNNLSSVRERDTVIYNPRGDFVYAETIVRGVYVQRARNVAPQPFGIPSQKLNLTRETFIPCERASYRNEKRGRQFFNGIRTNLTFSFSFFVPNLTRVKEAFLSRRRDTL